MFKIGEFSKISKTTIKALRYYESMGLLVPEQVDKITGYRLYTSNQLLQIHSILSLRQIGLSIEDIKLVLNSEVKRNSILENKKQEIEHNIQKEYDQLSRIEFILSKNEVYMDYQAIIKELPECIVYSTIRQIKNYDEYFSIVPAIGKKITEKYPDLKCSSPAYCFIKYLDGEYKENNFNIEFCEAVDSLEENFDDIVFKKIDSTLAVSIMHKGPYGQFSNAYAFIVKWIDENGYTIIDYPRENYIDGIWNKTDENDWLTEIQVPIKKKK